MMQAQAIEDVPLVDQRDIEDLLPVAQAPCISIYASTSPELERKGGNRIRYKERVQEVGHALEQRAMDRDERRELILQLERVGRTDDIRRCRPHGLAVFASPTRFRARRLMRPPRDLAIVGDSFYLRPLLRVTQHWQRYQVLCLSTDRVAFFECDRETIAPVRLHPAVPTSLSEATGEQARTPDRKDGPPPSEGSRESAQYCRRLDDAIRENHSARSRRPLLLVAEAEYQRLFREQSRNPHLLETRLERDPFRGLDWRGLGALAWATVEADLESGLASLVDRYRSGVAHGQGVDAIEQVARAAALGQVEVLLIEDGIGDYGDIAAPETDGLDDVTELVLRNQGRVQFLPRGRMPSNTGVAAILRSVAAEKQAVV